MAAGAGALALVPGRVHGATESPDLLWGLVHRNLADRSGPGPGGRGFTITYNSADPLLLALCFALLQVAALPWVLETVGRGVRALLGKLGIEEPESPPPSRPWASVRRRASVGFLVLLLFEMAVGPAIDGVRWGRFRLDLSQLRARAEAGDTTAMTELGQRLGWDGDYPEGREGRRWIDRAADLGDREAMYALGAAYDNGYYGVTKDEAAALEWYGRAGERGQKTAEALFENLATKRPDLPRARAWHRSEIASVMSAALAGKPRAMDRLVELHDRLGEEDEAWRWARASAKTGDDYSMVLLGQRLLDPAHGTPAPVEAAAWFEHAAACGGYQGAKAAWLRGRLDEEGKLGAPDDESALGWYRKAVSLESRFEDGPKSLAALRARRPELR